MDKVVTLDMNSILLEEFTEDEVRTSIFQMHPTKAPDPDSMNPIFFQHFWHIVGHDVSSVVIDCLSSGKILSSINLTHITLIPKRKNPESMSHFRPISLCNVIFKIVLKVLANKLKKILGTIISDCQSAFVPERVIIDNILISFEILHYIKTKRWGTSTHMALKLDMSKAYDRIEWDYLKALMLRMGFHPWWVNPVMAGISSVSYSVIVNGEASRFIKPSRGIKQGDTSSPYFIFTLF